MPQESYRCVECLGEVNRCTSCRARRQAARLALQAAKRAEGICLDCARKAVAGQTRCAMHQAVNAGRSGDAHVRRRVRKRRKRICLDCAEPVAAGYARCAEHLALRLAAQRARARRAG